MTYKYETSPWATEQMVGPLSAVEWGQRFEYFTVNGLSCEDRISPATGCVATATAQLMAYWKYGFFGTTNKYNLWDEIVQYSEGHPHRDKFFPKGWKGTLSEAPQDIKREYRNDNANYML